MLSDKGIKDYISRGMLKVDPLGQIGPASIDLHIGDCLYRSDAEAHRLYQEEIDRLAKRETFAKFLKKREELGTMSFDQYVSRFGKKVAEVDDCWILEPNKLHYAQTAETITTKEGVHVRIATRSSLARIGLRIQYSEDKLDESRVFKGKPFLVLQSYDTCVELPKNYPACQMVIETFRYIFHEEIKEAIKRGDITISKEPIIKYDSIILTFHPRLLRYNGRVVSPAKDNSGCFDEIDITHEYVLEPKKFYLASTQEIVGIGAKYCGILNEFANSTYVHLNSPYHWPGSNHSITLEIFSTQPKRIRAGNPACRLFIQQLYPECGSLYNSKYNGQEGPTISRSHL